MLAGGMGTRLKSVVADVPKPMALVNNTPFLHTLLNQLYKKGVKRFILAVGYQNDVIQAYFTSLQLPYEIVFSIEKEPLGTGGAIQLALKQANSPEVLVVNGDSFFDLKLSEFVVSAQQLEKTCTLALKKMFNSERYGSVLLQGSKLIAFQEKSYREEALINAGVYWVDKQKFTSLEFPKKFSFEKDFLEVYAEKDVLAGIEMEGYFIDIGIPEDYKQAQNDFERFTD